MASAEFTSCQDCGPKLLSKSAVTTDDRSLVGNLPHTCNWNGTPAHKGHQRRNFPNRSGIDKNDVCRD